MKAAVFTSDATPPIGHPLCGGWIAPAREIVDRQFVHGVLIVPEGQPPIVLCAVDWCWIRSEAHREWREKLAEAAGTQPNRVSIHCVHQHDALIPDPAADKILDSLHLGLHTLRGSFFDDTMARSAQAVRGTRSKLRNVSHVGTGQAKVEQVAANRRVLGPDGKVKFWRGSSCKSTEARAQPEGVIDPYLKCITLLDGTECVAALHYYATHPMSYYGEGGVSADFVGLARERLRSETKVHHVYFTGCAGNVSAGKYNSGSHEERPILSERMFRGMKLAFESTQPAPLGQVKWSSTTVHFPMSLEFTRAFFEHQLGDKKANAAQRIKGAMGRAWWDWHERGERIDLSALHLGDVHILNLPSEVFIEYQLYAQQFGAGLARPGATAEASPFIAVAAYGDCGPAYIPLDESYPQGGYEVNMAWVGPGSEGILKAAIRELLTQGAV